MRKRVYITTWLGWKNFGTQLQAYALQRKLDMLGFDARLLAKRYCGNDFPSFLITIGMWLGVYQLWERIQRREKPPRKIAKWHVLNHKVRNLWFPFQVDKISKCVDCFVVGSDQVWNTHLGFDPWFYLGFVGNKRKISYASSTGTGDINPIYAEQVQRLLQRFDYISVREKESVDSLAKLTGRKDIQQVVDPTLLLSKEEWQQVISSTHMRYDTSKKYILCYLLKDDKSYADKIRAISKKLGIERVVLVESLDNPGLRIEGVETIVNADPFEFLQLIANSSYVCTNSFHGTIFAIIFEKDFSEFMRFSDRGTATQNARVYDLLSKLKLENRIVNAQCGVNCDAIDYSPITPILDSEIKRSIEYLKKAIGG